MASDGPYLELFWGGGGIEVEGRNFTWGAAPWPPLGAAPAVLTQRIPPPRRLSSTESDRDSNPDSDASVCRTASKMLWIHYLVGVSHVAERRGNRPVTVRNANKYRKTINLINLLKSPSSATEKCSGTRIRDQITIKSKSVPRA